MREEDAVRALETLGLTGKEAAAYLNLNRSGASSAQQVSQLLGVQYPAVYRILQSLQCKGWIDISRERPNRYRARAPRIVAEEARQSRHDDLLAAAEVVAELKEAPPPKGRDADTDLWIYKGAEPIGRKLREVVLSSNSQILCVSPFPVAPEILRLLFDALGRSRRRVRVVLSETNRPDRINQRPPQSQHSRPVSLSFATPPENPVGPHLRLPERRGSLHPEFLLPGWRVRFRQTSGVMGRGHGLRPRPARGDAPRLV